MTNSTRKRRPPLTVAAALRRIAEDAVRRDPSLMKESPARDDCERATDNKPTSP